MAYLIFDERLTLTQVAGMAIAIAGVVLIAVRKPADGADVRT